MARAAVLTDIEGTTTDIAFVHSVLFPYARARMERFLREHAATPDVSAALIEIREMEGNAALGLNEIVTLLLAWSDADRKIKPLKTIQGLIWREGYEAGDLKAHLYPDAAAALRRWHAEGIPLYVYSSGSVAAQKLLFAHTPEGDLTALFSGYFDTAVGGKLDPGSYRKIAQEIALPADAILFLSDHAGELEAAAAAGVRVLQLDRARAPDSPPLVDGPVTSVSSFEWIDPEARSGLRRAEALR